MTSTGLSLESDRGYGSLYDRFRDRVIFPVHNISGRIVAFGGRTLRTDKKVAKYQNSPESDIYSKKRELYGIFFAKKAIQQLDSVIMVEGYTDVISMHQAGIENVVSSSGTSLTVEQVRLLSRFTKNITIIYDGDAAGVKAALRGIDLVLREGMDVRVVSLPTEHDPDSFARAHSAEQVREYITQHAQDFLSYKAKLLLGESEGDPIRRAEMVADMVESIIQITEPIKRSIFAKECAKIMDVDESVLLAEVARKCAVASNDRPTAEFITQQRRIINHHAAKTASEKSVEAGTIIANLERELTKYLLKSGHTNIDIRNGAETTCYNVATLIFSELDEVGISFSDSSLNAILTQYRTEWESLGEGIEIPTTLFTHNADSEICQSSASIISWDDNYTPSQLWSMKQMYSASDNEIMTTGLPKALILYKSKVLESMIKEKQVLLKPGISEEEEMKVLSDLARLNKAKTQIANRLKRLIL